MDIKIQQFYQDQLKTTNTKSQRDATDFVRTINIPTMTLKDPFLKFTEKALIGIIYSFVSNKRKMFASNRFLAASLGLLNPLSVTNLLTGLEQKGYIVRIYADKNKYVRESITLSSEYFLLIHGIDATDAIFPQSTDRQANDTVNNGSKGVYETMGGDTLKNGRGDTLKNVHTKQGITKQITKRSNFSKKTKAATPSKITKYNRTQKDYLSIVNSLNLIKYEISINLVDRYYEKVQTYMESSGKRYKNHIAAIRNFMIKDVEAKKFPAQYNPMEHIRRIFTELETVKLPK